MQLGCAFVLGRIVTAPQSNSHAFVGSGRSPLRRSQRRNGPPRLRFATYAHAMFFEGVRKVGNEPVRAPPVVAALRANATIRAARTSRLRIAGSVVAHAAWSGGLGTRRAPRI